MIYNRETAQKTNAEELSSDAELYKGQPPKVFNYDPNHVPELTTAQMSEIEDAVHNGWTNGEDPAKIQAMVNERLAALGFNPAEVQDGALVGKVVGDDGEETRAFVVDAGDFGTRIRNAELNPVSTDSEAAVVDHPAEEAPVEEKSSEQSAEEARAQEYTADAIAVGLFDQVRVVENRMGEDADMRRAGQRVVADFIDRMTKLSYVLRQGDGVNRNILQNVLNEFADPARRAVVQETEYANTEARAAQGLDSALADAVTEARKKLDEAHAVAMGAKLKKVEVMMQDLRANRSTSAYAAEAVRDNTMGIITLLDQMQYDTHGMETYGHQINAKVEALKQAFGEADMRRNTAATTIEELKKELATAV